MPFIDVQQNTDEWLDLRAGKITGSTCAKIMANYGKPFGAPAMRLAVKIALERVKGSRIESDQYSNAHMERGHVQEPIARTAYENEYFVDVDNGGFFDEGIYGCSPDGLIETDGVIEIKSVIYNVHYDTIKRGGFDPAYKWQLYFNLKVTGREWIDFVSYCEDYTDESKLYVYRVAAEDSKKFFEMIDVRTLEFLEVIEEIEFNIKGGRA